MKFVLVLISKDIFLVKDWVEYFYKEAYIY